MGSSCKSINLNTSAGEYIKKINFYYNETAIDYLKFTSSNNKTISVGPVPKTSKYISFNETNVPAGFFGAANNKTGRIYNFGVVVTNLACRYSQILNNAPELISEARTELQYLQEQAKKKRDTLIGAIVGGTVGAVILITGITLLILWKQKKIFVKKNLNEIVASKNRIVPQTEVATMSTLVVEDHTDNEKGMH